MNPATTITNWKFGFIAERLPDYAAIWSKRLGVGVFAMIVCGQLWLGYQYFFKSHPVVGTEYTTEQRSVK